MRRKQRDPEQKHEGIGSTPINIPDPKIGDVIIIQTFGFSEITRLFDVNLVQGYVRVRTKFLSRPIKYIRINNLQYVTGDAIRWIFTENHLL